LEAGASIPAYRLVQRARAEARRSEWLERDLTAKNLDSARVPKSVVGPIAAGEK